MTRLIPKLIRHWRVRRTEGGAGATGYRSPAAAGPAALVAHQARFDLKAAMRNPGPGSSRCSSRCCCSSCSTASLTPTRR